MPNIFFTVQSDYVSRLGLKGGELLVYSLVASFPDGWRLNVTTTAQLLGMTRMAFYNIIHSLTEKDLICATEKDGHRVFVCKENLQSVKKIYTTQTDKSVKKVDTKCKESLHTKCKENLHYNNIKNNIKNKEYKVCDTRTREDENFINIEKAGTNTTANTAADFGEKKKVAPKKKRTAELFTPPSEEEVAAYIAEKGWQVDARHWHAYYTANGWKVGKHTMKDWRAAVKTWQYNGITNNKKSSYEQRKQTSGSDNFCGCDTL